MKLAAMGTFAPMTEQANGTNEGEYEDQDAEPTMTAPDDERPDADVTADAGES